MSKISYTPGIGLKQKINVSQDDVGREITIELYEGFLAYSPPSGTTAIMHGTKPSGLGFSVNGTISGSVISFVTTAAMTSESGRIDAEVVLSSGETVIGTANFLLCVEKSPHPSGTVDGTTDDVINAIEEARDEAIADIGSMMISATDDGNGNITITRGV